MKDFINKRTNFNTIEFWAATTIFVFVVFFFITEAVENISNLYAPNKRLFDQGRTRFYYYENYFIPLLLRYVFIYCAFLFMNFSVVPKLIKKESLLLNISITIIIFLLTGALFGITDTYLKGYLFNQGRSEDAVYNSLFQNSFLYSAWLFLLFGFYSVIKYVGLYILSHSDAIQAKYKFITPGGLAAFVLWMVSMFCLLIADAHRIPITVWGIIIPFGISLYWYCFYSLIPKALRKKHPFRFYLGRIIFLLIVTAIPVTIIAMLLLQDEEGSFGLASFNIAFQLLITAPLTWVLFKRYIKGNEELYLLKKELGQTNANFDFLRSQINPHFLFNALNTIYGTAIQEKAERTSEGIEKLGDMMRFMLQENMQDKISLAREIEYLGNYISLQKLRTDPNPSVHIQTVIEQPVGVIQIAPMLLIPFVENAFKHGISFREPSHIKITLEVKDNKLYFDVYNSKHQKPENDPEKGKSGIGLNNVRQRLQLVYPGRHELIVRETGKDFFVHLTIQFA